MRYHDLLLSPYYIIKDVIKTNTDEPDNPHHADVIGKRCTVISLHVGRSAQLLVDVDYDYDPHRFWTSAVKRVVQENNMILIETRNSKYILEREAPV